MAAGLLSGVRFFKLLCTNTFKSPQRCFSHLAKFLHQKNDKLTDSFSQDPMPSGDCISANSDQMARINRLFIRGKKRVNYRPSAWKRIHKHGLHKRMLTPGGIGVLWRRLIKGRHVLTVYDRLLVDLPTTMKKQKTTKIASKKFFGKFL